MRGVLRAARREKPVTTPSDGGTRDSFTFDELADLRSGVLSEEAERDLRCRMESEPEEAQRMIDALDAVEREFPDPPNAHDPLRLPPPVAARWQEVIAREATRRASGEAQDQSASPTAGPAEAHSNRAEEQPE